ncbi:MAG: LysM peptidoglycan-binding domain-containing protein [Anaerolineae bacterium]|nr:LysM peptidoglycan-binding domain-containing protein [Anaerolineae bacterium]MDK1081876.1 LysM peptidoglycan-binding domain-containing protein [Anaerolineae bacterium]MDK1118913.1 LysM peptidoglycan-binding domain-containing protein [Anaerolineae bacterium]
MSFKPMPNRKSFVVVFSTLALTAIGVSGCIQPYSTILETPTVGPTSLFVSPIATSDNPLGLIEEFATSTALAQTSVALTAGTNPVTEAPGTETPPNGSITATSDGSLVPTETATPDGDPLPTTPTATEPLPTVTTNRPASYTLQIGEFPYCIARRFDVDQVELLSLNGLSSGIIYYPNLTLTIPQSGNPFAGTRARNPHPDTYTATSGNTNLHHVACYYGDIDPAAIAQANNLQLDTILTVGQQLTIP